MSDLATFLLNTGRTLSQMALYTSSHPQVRGAVQACYHDLQGLLEETPEIVLSVLEKKFLVNGKPQENLPETATRPFVLLLNKFNLHSLSFLRGITLEEMMVFFNLASQTEAKKITTDLNQFLTGQNVTQIKVNLAKYAKIGEDETVGGAEGGTATGNAEDFVKELERLPLQDFLAKLIDRAIPNPAAAKLVLQRAFDLVKKEIMMAVKKATDEFNNERSRLTGERDRTEGVVESVADGIVVVDENGRVLMMNPTAEEMYGVKLGECVGKQLWEKIKEEQMMALAKDLSSPSDRPMTKEVQLRATEETKRILRASSAQIQNPEGRVVGMVSVLSDVTKQRELTRLQNEFMANVTHDLRTPIHALQLAVAAILEGSAGAVTPEQQKMLSLANRNVERLSRLIDDLLDFSQIESGSMRVKPQILDLNPVLKDAIASLEPWAKSRGINLVFEEARDLAPVYADSDRMLQVVNNLISNAVKFTSAGGTVTLRAKNTKEKGRPAVTVEVEDTGRGISKEDQKRIFERFVQLKNAEKLDVRGTGIGLSICRALIELHKGSMGISSPPPGKPTGSLFYFVLPSVQKSDMPAPGHTPKEPEPLKKGKGGFWSRLFRFKILFLAVIAAPVLLQARPYWGTVRRVLSGDLVQLADGTKVRYLGVEAPKIGEASFQEAISANRRLVEGREVKFEYGLQERGLDGIWLAYAFVDGVFVNKELVREGVALVAPLSNEESYLPDFVQAERDALSDKLGLWKNSNMDPYAVRIQKKKSPIVSSPSPSSEKKE